jgi:hypothetical protein
MSSPAERKKPHLIARVNAVVSLVIALIAAAAGCAQAIIAATQPAPLPQIQARSIAELRIQIEDRRKGLQREMEHLDALLEDIGRAQAALTGTSARTPATSTATATDEWWRTMLKTFVVYIVLAFAVTFSMLALVIDLFGLLFDGDFYLLRTLWGFAWSETTLSWYWNRGSGVGIALGVAALVTLSMIGPLLDQWPFKAKSDAANLPIDPAGEAL